jgi:hypothetical protein
MRALLLSLLATFAIVPLTSMPASAKRAHVHEWRCPVFERNCDCPGGRTSTEECVRCACDRCPLAKPTQCFGCRC